MAIRLDNLKQSTTEVNSLENGYLYKDIDLDLSFDRYTKKEIIFKNKNQMIYLNYKMVLLFLIQLRIYLQPHLDRSYLTLPSG